jgi:hypothetical protein
LVPQAIGTLFLKGPPLLSPPLGVVAKPQWSIRIDPGIPEFLSPCHLRVAGWNEGVFRFGHVAVVAQQLKVGGVFGTAGDTVDLIGRGTTLPTLSAIALDDRGSLSRREAPSAGWVPTTNEHGHSDADGFDDFRIVSPSRVTHNAAAVSDEVGHLAAELTTEEGLVFHLKGGITVGTAVRHEQRYFGSGHLLKMPC